MSSNPERANPNWPSVVVASAFQTGMLLMRNLERRGVNACCIDHKLSNPGFRSVYGSTHQCPDPDARPDDWAQFMSEFGSSFAKKPVLIPAGDQFVSAMARHASTLDRHFTFFASSIKLQAALSIKQTLYGLAAEHGFPIPLTRRITKEADAIEFAAAARYPCLMKPEHARMWKRLPANHPCFDEKLARAMTAEELVANYVSVAAITPDVVVQEEILGPDTSKLVYLSCYSGTADRLGYVVLRELRTDNPIQMGSASIVEPVVDTETETLCDEFLRKLNYRGLCEIEVKRDSRDGKVKMIEANPRYTATSDAAPYDGVDIGWLHYLDLVGQPITPVKPLVRNFRHVMIMRDVSSMRHYVARGLETWGSIARSYRRPVHFFDLDPRDWRNLARTIVAIARLLGGIIYRKLFRKEKIQTS